MKFALAGNPNSGKTTLFNALTGSTAHVGNWPGVTVDKKTGFYKKLTEKVEIVDLPGIYSLSPYTPEETVARNYLLAESPECIINIVDVTNLERNLYLTTQLLELDIPVVIALNMIDVLEKNGDTINSKQLEERLNVPVVEISALKGRVGSLMQTAFDAAKKQRKGNSVLESSSISRLYESATRLYDETKTANAVFKAVKMIENDPLELCHNAEIAKKVQALKANVGTGIFEGDYEALIADARYKYICAHLKDALKKAPKKITKSAKIDKILTHKIFGIPIFIAIMLAVFHLTFSEDLLFLGVFIPKGSFDVPIIGKDAINSPGVMLFNIVDWLTSTFTGFVGGTMPANTWYSSLIVDGILNGLSAVLSFIPQIMVLFLFISILEESGYMARVAFILDRAFRKFGLSGRAFMPLVMCFGCAVPGIMATRTLSNDSERRRTVMLAPFFSCGAKLPIWAAFAGVFAHAYSSLNAEFVVTSMYLLGIAVAVCASLILKRTAIKGDAATFIMELPDYRSPQFKNTMIYLWQKLKHYIFRAATVIAGAIVVIWFLSSFSFTLRYVDDISDSILATISKGLRYLFVPLGFGMGEDGWKFVVAAITGLIAKEMVVASMGVLSGFGESALEGNIAGTALGTLMLGIGGTLGGYNVSIPAMFAFMAFNLLGVPCMAAVSAAKSELKSRKMFWFAIAFWFGTSYVISALIFWFGTLIIVNPYIAFTLTLVIIATAAIALVCAHDKKQKAQLSLKERE